MSDFAPWPPGSPPWIARLPPETAARIADADCARFAETPDRIAELTAAPVEHESASSYGRPVEPPPAADPGPGESPNHAPPPPPDRA